MADRQWDPNETPHEHIGNALQLLALAMPDKNIITAQRGLLQDVQRRLERAQQLLDREMLARKAGAA